jgi:hypothetical protein
VSVVARHLALVALCLVVAAPAHGATRRFFSYDPDDAETRHAAGALTFEFDQHLTSTTVLRVRATEGEATAELRRAGQTALGAGGLTSLIGPAPQRDLYEVEPQKEGAAMIAALCPGARHAWLAFERLKVNHDTRVLVLADGPSTRPRLCRALAFSFHGEWRLPPGAPIDERRVQTPHFPY